MSTPDHHEDRDCCGGNAAPYVLGALEPEECEAFQGHLATCAVCREEVASLQLVADALPVVAPQLSAPPELKSRIMATVQGEAGWQRSPAGAPAQPGPRSPRRPRLALGSWRAAGAVAAVAAAAAIAAIALQPGGGAKVQTIRAQVIAPHASASLRLSGGHAQLNVAGLPQTTPGRVYEVWIKRGGAAQPTDALFTVTATGRATVGVPGGTAGVKQVMVTSEPLGGSRVPTRAPVIIANLG
jgi:anti-sigma-K factor RskA